MYILGLNAYHWDSSACLLKDGKVVAASEEERFNRIKHWSGLPVKAIAFCLQSEGISLTDIDYISIGHDPKANIGKKITYAITNLIAPDFILRRLKRTGNIGDIKSLIAIELGVDPLLVKAVVHNIEHHRSHLASAFFASPYKESAVISIDAFGDFTSTMRAVGKDNKIEVIDSVTYPHSLGMFYTALTQYLGFNHVGDEYKIMGLAPYGKPVYVEKLKNIITLKRNGGFELNAKYFNYFRKGVVMEMRNDQPYLGKIFSSSLEKLFGPARQPAEEITNFHKDIAASVQRLTEEIILHVIEDLKMKTSQQNLCIAGGVAQNSVANGKIALHSGFDNVYVPSAGHDAGIAMGSALYLYHHILDKPRTEAVFSAYTGSRFTNEEIELILKEKNIPYKKLEDEQLFDIVTNKLIEPGVVGWFNGRAEFGPRALGARSILADPRNPNAKDLLNSKIKRRESFRPFAPSILKEFSGEYFESDAPVPFMEKVFPIKPEKQALIPAVTHVDGTGRLQTVDKQVAPRYYGLIDCFRKKTGIPILLNTSFNENEPIVNSPLEALDCFLRTQMDMLVLENCVIDRKELK